MLPHDICRTCALHNADLLALSTHTEKYANKSYCDMLHELTQNDPLVENLHENLPQHLCADCLCKLESAYDFVLQARQVQEQLLHKIRKGLECLEETPIDISTEHIKTETDIAFEQPKDDVEGDTATVSMATLKVQPESDTDSSKAAEDEADNDVLDLKPLQLRRSCRKPKLSTDSENEEACENLSAVPTKRRRGRPARLPRKETVNKDGRHVCEVCGKTFSWHRDMQRHARVHYEQAGYVCDSCGKEFIRKDKYMFHMRSHEKRQAKQQALQLSQEWRFAERLYSSGRLKRIECKLCGLKCQKIQELREHLFMHGNIETLSNLSLHNDVVLEHFANEARPLDLLDIRMQVSADIAQGRACLDKYCCVVNALGYELCLSDSDEECAEETPPYHCLPCNTSFSRKHRLMSHTLEEHTQPTTQTFPGQRCSHCQIGFVCDKLMELHQRTQCNNPLKRYTCFNCPGKFMWPENLRHHACPKSAEVVERDRTQGRKIECSLCGEQLPRMSALRAHLLTHADGNSGINWERSTSIISDQCPDAISWDQNEISRRIVIDFEAQDYGRYFNACTGSGQELDFLDSDTELSDPSALAVHSCELCGVSTPRLAQLLGHQRKLHSAQLDALPHVCVTCGLGFVAEALLQQHRRRSCAKRHSKYQCEHCNLRFIWKSNHERHVELHHEQEAETGATPEELPNTRLRSKRQEAAKLQCSECDKVFIWPKDLTRHKRIHQPQASAQYECSHCERKFHRKDGLKSHMRVHGEQPLETAASMANNEPDLSVWPLVWTQLCQPNGCKQIQCMICLSRHSKIADLRTHLLKHQFVVHFVEERAQPAGIATICRALYPDQVTTLDKQQLIERIQRDVGAGVELERFVSITNEASLELSLDSSETDTDSDTALGLDDEVPNSQYSCELCQLKLPRKHQLYAHQLEQHTWQQATNVCTHCQARFISDQLLEHHYRTLCRNPHKRFLCRKCPFRFRWRDNLKLHMDIAHQEVTGEHTSLAQQLNGSSLLPVVSYDCGECNRSFKMQKDLTRHTLMHSKDSSIYRCRWCARRFYRQANLLQHIERHGIHASQLHYAETLLNASRNPNGQKCIQCKVCDLNFPTILALRDHLTSTPQGTHHAMDSMLNYSITNQQGYELHLDDSETDEELKQPGTPTHYTCGMCQLRCVRKFELHQHQQAMHRLERITEGCDQCIFKSVCPDLIAYHQRTQCGNTEKQFKCVHCGYKFMWEANLLLHIELQHSSQDGHEEVSTVLEGSSTECHIFQCGQCPRKYNRKDRLTAHVKKCHAPGVVGSALQSPTKTTALPTVAKQQKSFLCAFCGKAVSSSSNLIIHIRRHTGEKPFKCDYCDMAFPRSSDLQCHRRTHTGERPHVCTVCQKGFARSYKLQQHMRIHNGERPYKCTYCDKSFTQSNDLTLHIRRHTGERPYQCDTCGERFIQGTALKNHRQQNGHFEASVGLVADK